MCSKRWLYAVFSFALALLCSGFFGWSHGTLAQEAMPDDQLPTSSDSTPPIGPGFLYRGELYDAGAPVDGSCDIEFRLFNAASPPDQQLGLPSTVLNLSVIDGYFTALVNGGDEFGGEAFDGYNRWLEMAVRCPASSGAYATLNPRQQIHAVPYALYALAGNDEHDHMGQTWTGGPGLTIDGDDTAMTLTATNEGARIHDSNVGLHVSGDIGYKGIIIEQVGEPTQEGHGHYIPAGIMLNSIGGDGIEVGWADVNGMTVYGAGSSGLSVQQAGIGVELGTVGSGITIQSTDYDGYSLTYGGRHGLYIESTADSGVKIDAAGQDGINIDEAGNHGVAINTTRQNGFYVRTAGNHGVLVYGADTDGVQVGAAGQDGLSVGTAGRYGVYVRSAGSAAGYFNGDVQVTGNLTKGSGSFRIDHPLNPERQYLSHSFVESPDMLNIYNGNVTLNETGTAWVAMPDWFGALNHDFRYQLTAIGAPGPDLHIANPIAGNRFQIGGGTPGMTVSWQVTGIRQDPYALAHPIEVETEKSDAEIGRYLHPLEWGKPIEMGILPESAAPREAMPK